MILEQITSQESDYTANWPEDGGNDVQLVLRITLKADGGAYAVAFRDDADGKVLAGPVSRKLDRKVAEALIACDSQAHDNAKSMMRV